MDTSAFAGAVLRYSGTSEAAAPGPSPSPPQPRPRRRPPRGFSTAAGGAPDTRTGGTAGADAEAAAPDLNNIAIQQDPAHILRRAPSREGPRRAVPQCRRRSRTPCRPARRPLQSRTAPGPAAAGGGSEAPGSAGRAASHPPPTARPPPGRAGAVTCHRLRRRGGRASPSSPPAAAAVRSLQLAPRSRGGQEQPQEEQAGRQRPHTERSEPAHRYRRCRGAKAGTEGRAEGR